MASEEANVKLSITWKPFLLRADLPPQGLPKSGTPQSRVPTHLQQAGKAVGINFTGLTDSTPNTIDFHAVMKYLLDMGVDQTPFQEAIFRAYFTQGIFPDNNVLKNCLETIGAGEEVLSIFNQSELFDQYRRQVVTEAQEARNLGVRGVPSFIFGDDTKPAFSGAQDIKTFVSHLGKHSVESSEAS